MENIEQRSGDERHEAPLDLANTTFKIGPDTKFEIKSMETNKDGSVDIALDMDDKTKEDLCTTFGWDKVTEDRLQTLVISALDWYIKDKDGGDKASTVNEEQESAAE